MTLRAIPALPLLDLDLLRTLLAIAETGSFSAAAAAVLRTPSAISMQVKKVEDMLGRPVFLRDSRSVAPTADGEFLIGHARRMLELNRQALARFVAPDLQGEVRLGATDDVAERLLPPMLRRFAEGHPGVGVEVTVENSRRLLQMVGTGRLDLALVTCGGGEEAGETLYSEDLVWAAAANGVAAERRPLPISVWEDGCAWRRAGLQALKAAGRDWRVVFKSAHTAGQKAAVKADLAIAPLPASHLGGGIVEAPARLALPPLPAYSLGLALREDASAPVLAAARHLRSGFTR